MEVEVKAKIEVKVKIKEEEEVERKKICKRSLKLKQKLTLRKIKQECN
jgi:hypothetical protein